MHLRPPDRNGNTGGECPRTGGESRLQTHLLPSPSLLMGTQKQWLSFDHGENGSGVGDDRAENRREAGCLNDLGGQTCRVNLNFPLGSCV